MKDVIKKYEEGRLHLAIAAELVSEARELLEQEFSEDMAEAMGARLSKAEAAGLLGCSPRTVTRRLDKGALESLKIKDVLHYKRNQ